MSLILIITEAKYCKENLDFLWFIYQWRIQDFPEEGALTPKEGVPTYYLANFSRKLHENEEILGRGGARPLRPPLDPPLYTVSVLFT